MIAGGFACGWAVVLLIVLVIAVSFGIWFIVLNYNWCVDLHMVLLGVARYVLCLYCSVFCLLMVGFDLLICGVCVWVFGDCCLAAGLV